MKKIGVYAAMFGYYDDSPRATFPTTLFTDQNVNPPGWNVVNVKAPCRDNSYSSRYYFNQSCLVMPDYEFTIMHSSAAHITASPERFLELLPNGIDIACWKHPHRENVYQEADACIRFGKDKPEIINAQMERYRAEGFPESVVLSACILLVRRNTPELREFETFWWNEVKNGSCRDQLSFDYTRWKLGIPIARIPGDPYLRSDLFKVKSHLSRKKSEKTIAP